MVIVCTTTFNILKKSLHIVDTLYVCITVLALNTVYFPKRNG